MLISRNLKEFSSISLIIFESFSNIRSYNWYRFCRVGSVVYILSVFLKKCFLILTFFHLILPCYFNLVLKRKKNASRNKRTIVKKVKSPPPTTSEFSEEQNEGIYSMYFQCVFILLYCCILSITLNSFSYDFL